MTIGLETKIFRALTDHLDTFANAQGLEIARPAVPFSPTDGAAYLKVYFIPTTTEAMDIAGLINEYRGILQVSVIYPGESGIVAPLELAAAVADHFQSGTVVTHGATTFKIQQPPQVGPTIDDGAWTIIPVSVRYRAFLTP
jgi:hypothetical protein